MAPIPCAPPRSSTTRTFSADGRLLSILDGATVRVALDYDSSGHLSAAHYRGNADQFRHRHRRPHHVHQGRRRPLGKLYLQRRWPARAADQRRWTDHAYQYDAAGNLTSLTWAGGKTAIAYAGDPGFLSVASVTTPDGAVRQYDTPRAPGRDSRHRWQRRRHLVHLQRVRPSANHRRCGRQHHHLRLRCLRQPHPRGQRRGRGRLLHLRFRATTSPASPMPPTTAGRPPTPPERRASPTPTRTSGP